MASVTTVCMNQLLTKHNVTVWRGHVDSNCDHRIVHQFNQTVAERLFGHQYAHCPTVASCCLWVF